MCFNDLYSSLTLYVVVMALVVLLLSMIMMISVCMCNVSCHDMLDENEQKIYDSFQQECSKANNIGKAVIVIGKESQKYFFCPLELPDSCSAIHNSDPSAPSGFYNIAPSNLTVETVYCDMKGHSCDGEGGWMRIANYDMTMPGASCPNGIPERSFNDAANNLCGRGNDSAIACNSTSFNTFGIKFGKVCGQIRGYQYGSTKAFSGSGSINSAYLDGVSVTTGIPRHHIWSYAAGWNIYCPCNNSTVFSLPTPSFVGTDYFCETAVISNSVANKFLFSSDPLWDGLQCNSTPLTDEAPCCIDPNMPWFVKDLNKSITDNIELRVCNTDNMSTGNALLDIIELYIK